MQGEQQQIQALEQRGRVQSVDADEGRRGARDEDAELVDGGVGRVEGAVAAEGGAGEGEEEGWGDALVDAVLGDVD